MSEDINAYGDIPEVDCRFRDIAVALTRMHADKNKDYGSSFEQSVKKYGLISALTRISDKYNRAENLILKGELNAAVKDETLRDTLADLASYCIMTIMILDDK